MPEADELRLKQDSLGETARLQMVPCISVPPLAQLMHMPAVWAL